ncbi:hypothetical protein SORBI_3001G031500 [Sorghum bicolor]|uniref:Uncharacterized protein n=1 Tax=Sorghum bicolor TaxID=4558 RepID=A0A1B6QH36_SORBI|nr:hypothetical protein SORBI_3001G031500 [Sorghum bicolor]
MPLQGTDFPALAHLQLNPDGKTQEGTTVAGGARSTANIQKIGASRGARAREEDWGACLSVHIYKGRGLNFPERPNLGERIGDLLGRCFFSNHANFSFGNINSLLLEML